MGFARLRAVPASTWAKLGFALLCIGALVGFLAIPTYPTYDSYYALIWGRDVLHLHVPGSTSTERPPSTRWRSPSGWLPRCSVRQATA